MSFDNTRAPSGPVSPLEKFLRDYAETTGGIWDEVEPQVYDLILPFDDERGNAEIVRVAFDPEAIPEHPGAQLASYGTPLIDRLLGEAVARGRRITLHVAGLNLSPPGLEDRARRAISLAPGFNLTIEAVRPLFFPQALFWFEATFSSDQKEQEILPVAVDLHHRRQVRHIDRLLEPTRLSETPTRLLAEASHIPLASAYPIARNRVVRTLAAMANTRQRELSDRLTRQLERVNRYYADLRAEVDEQARRAQSRNDDPARLRERTAALHREEQLRVAELRQKSQLKISLRVLNLLEIHQPKLLLQTRLTGPGPRSTSCELAWVWDPLVDNLEALDCPQCNHPTFEVGFTRGGLAACSQCTSQSKPAGKH
jgi:hypothetical protein